MKRLLLLLLLWPSVAFAQLAPLAGTTLTTTSAAATSACIGCPVGSSTPAANSGVTTATVVLKDAVPSSTTNKLYQSGGALYFNGLSLATGSSVSGTTGTVPKFTGATALGDSNATISGNNWTFASATLTATLFSGSGASLTSIPTSAVSSGNFVATVGSGTGITSSTTTGNAAATTITLNNTAVTPSTYGSATAIPQFTVDQQGRLTAASALTPQLTLTSTYFSSLSGTALTGVALLASLNTFSAFGTTAFTASGTGVQQVQITNTSAGTGNIARLGMGNDTGASVGFLDMYSSTFTTSGRQVANGMLLENDKAGGISIAAVDGAGVVRIYSGGTAQRAQYDAAGNYIHGSGTNITDSNGTPVIASGFGTGSPTIAGSDYAFRVSVGTGAPTSGVITFGHTFANAPICVGSVLTASPSGVSVSFLTASSTQVSVQLSAGLLVNEQVWVLCRGY